jgi:hypothetical protein
MTFDIKGIVAVLVVIGSFGLIGIYVLEGHVPDATVAGIVGTALGLVLGFYFGHVNGSTQAAANQAAQLSLQATQILTAAQQRRAGDPVPSATPAGANP